MDTGHRTQPRVNRDTGTAPGPSGASSLSKKRRETIIRNERLWAALGMAAHPMEHPERALGCRGRSFNLCRLQPLEPYPHIPGNSDKLISLACCTFFPYYFAFFKGLPVGTGFVSPLSSGFLPVPASPCVSFPNPLSSFPWPGPAGGPGQEVTVPGAGSERGRALPAWKSRVLVPTAGPGSSAHPAPVGVLQAG